MTKLARSHADHSENSTAVTGIVCISLSVFFQSSATVFGKMAGNFSLGKNPVFLVINPWYLASIIVLGLQAICWIFVLRRFALSFAYPFMSLIFPLNLIWARLFFKEAIGWNHLCGTVLILVGVVVISREVQE
jgi:drug/metabolite transporter (DMT)-like permease